MGKPIRRSTTTPPKSRTKPRPPPMRPMRQHTTTRNRPHPKHRQRRHTQPQQPPNPLQNLPPRKNPQRNAQRTPNPRKPRQIPQRTTPRPQNLNPTNNKRQGTTPSPHHRRGSEGNVARVAYRSRVFDSHAPAIGGIVCRYGERSRQGEFTPRRVESALT